MKWKAAESLQESLQYKINGAIEMLREYNHLLLADQIDCSYYFPAERTMPKPGQGIEDDADEEHVLSMNENNASYM